MFLDHRGTYLEEIRAYLGAAMYPLQVAINSPAAGARWMRENLALRERLIDRERHPAPRGSRPPAPSCSVWRPCRPRTPASAPCSTPSPGSRTGWSSARSWRWTWTRCGTGSSSTRAAGTAPTKARPSSTPAASSGQITRDQQDSSEAILITDPDHAVPVEIVRNGLRTIAMGTGDLERLSLPFLTRNADIKTGDLLVTSGLGGAFPAGYPVGTVTTVDGSSGDAFLEVAAKPAASLDRLHEVLLVFQQRGAAAGGPRPQRGTASAGHSPVPGAPQPAADRPEPAAPGQSTGRSPGPDPGPDPELASPGAPATAAGPGAGPSRRCRRPARPGRQRAQRLNPRHRHPWQRTGYAGRSRRSEGTALAGLAADAAGTGRPSCCPCPRPCSPCARRGPPWWSSTGR